VASKTVVELFDDLDGGRADETVRFAMDGVEYEIDLSKANAAALRGVLTDYIAHAHPVSGQPRRAARPTADPGPARAKTGRARVNPNASMTAEIRRLASESARKVSEAKAAEADTAEDVEPDLFTTAPDALAERTAERTEQGEVGPVPALVIPFQEAGL
jgi:hypothetical protein